MKYKAVISDYVWPSLDIEQKLSEPYTVLGQTFDRESGSPITNENNNEVFTQTLFC